MREKGKGSPSLIGDLPLYQALPKTKKARGGADKEKIPGKPGNEEYDSIRRQVFPTEKEYFLREWVINIMSFRREAAPCSNYHAPIPTKKTTLQKTKTTRVRESNSPREKDK